MRPRRRYCPRSIFVCDIADEIADDFDPVHSGDRKVHAREFFLDQDQQLELIERVKIKIVSEVRFVCNSFGIDT